jgi:hypothetical protein
MLIHDRGDPMKIAILICQVLCLALLVHIDWHVGRPGHHLSLQWQYHWVIGAIVFGWMGWRAGRSSAVNALRDALLLIAASLFIGHIVEALGEVVVYGDSWASVMPPIRWRIFVEFALAGVIAFAAAFAVARRTGAATAATRSSANG